MKIRLQVMIENVTKSKIVVFFKVSVWEDLGEMQRKTKVD